MSKYFQEFLYILDNSVAFSSIPRLLMAALSGIFLVACSSDPPDEIISIAVTQTLDAATRNSIAEQGEIEAVATTTKESTTESPSSGVSEIAAEAVSDVVENVSAAVQGAVNEEVISALSSPLGSQNSWVSFLSEDNKEETWEVYVISEKGEGPFQLTTSFIETKSKLVGIEDYAWSPDGKRLAYIADQGLYVMELDGLGVAEIAQTDMPSFRGGSLAWSPDGEKILYHQQRGDEPFFDLYVIDSSGGEPAILAENINQGGLSWSPEGSKIMYLSDEEAGDALYTMSSDGSIKTRVSRQDSIKDQLYTTPSWTPSFWSPDGSRIIFAGTARTATGANTVRVETDSVFSMDIYGYDVQALVDHAAFSQSFSDLSLSKDGKLVAFEHTFQDVEPPYDVRKQISVVGTDGSNFHQIAESTPVMGVRCPKWSPDGSKILYISAYDLDDRQDLVISDADGSNSNVVFTGDLGTECENVSWKPSDELNITSASETLTPEQIELEGDVFPDPQAMDESAGTSLGFLREYEGKDPQQVLVPGDPLYERLYALMGVQYELLPPRLTVNVNFQLEEPILWAHGLAPHSGGMNEAIILADLQTNVLRVALLVDQEIYNFQEGEWTGPIPSFPAESLEGWQ